MNLTRNNQLPDLNEKLHVNYFYQLKKNLRINKKSTSFATSYPIQIVCVRMEFRYDVVRHSCQDGKEQTKS